MKRSARQARGTHLFPTALGTCGVAWTRQGICAVQLPMSSEAELARLLSRLAQPNADLPRGVLAAVERIQRHLEGQPDSFAGVKLDLKACPPFARLAYGRSRRIKAGRTISYGELASRCGSPGGARAAGRAMATNPAPLLVPCHRVLAADGGLGGFSAHGGLATKLRLLTIEGADLSPVAHAGTRQLARQDQKLAPIIRRVGRFRLLDQRRADPFTALAESIVHQQVSMKAGATIFGRLLALGGEQRTLAPSVVLRCTAEQLRGVGLSRQKQAYVTDLAHRTEEGTLPLKRLERMDDEAVIEALTRVKGIGRWSAQMFLMFRLGRLDVLPVDDLGLRKGVARLLDVEQLPGPGQIQQLARRWVPYRSLATWYLWRSLDTGGL